MRKLFEVGDRVRCHMWKGVAEIISIEEGAKRPIRVSNDFGDSWRFLEDGRYYSSDHEATLRHAETGTPPTVGVSPKRFEYPLYRKSRISGVVVEFTGLTTGTVLASGKLGYRVGETLTDFPPHLDDWWEPCEKPKWEPTKPTWCWVWDDCYAARTLLFVIKYCEHPEGAPSETDYNYVVYNPSVTRTVYRNAEPCKGHELPSYWPKEWV